MIESFPTYAAGDMPTAEQFNRLCQAVEMLCKLTASPPLQVNQDAFGFTFSLDDDSLTGQAEMVKVTSLTAIGDYYPALLQSWSGTEWIDGDLCYFLPANSETPALQRYGSVFELTDPDTGLDVYSEQVDGSLTITGNDANELPITVAPATSLALDPKNFVLSENEPGAAAVGARFRGFSFGSNTGNTIDPWVADTYQELTLVQYYDHAGCDLTLNRQFTLPAGEAWLITIFYQQWFAASGTYFKINFALPGALGGIKYNTPRLSFLPSGGEPFGNVFAWSATGIVIPDDPAVPVCLVAYSDVLPSGIGQLRIEGTSLGRYTAFA